MSPAKATACFDQLARVVGVNVLHLVVGGEELSKGSLGVVRVVVACWVGHDSASVLVKHNQSVFISMPTRSVVLCKDDVGGGKGVCITSWDECFVCCVIRCGLRWSIFPAVSAAGCVLYHGPRANFTVRVLGRVRQVV